MSNTVAWGAAIDGASQPMVYNMSSVGSCASDTSGNVYTYVGSGTINTSIIIRNTDGTAFATFNATGDDTGILVKRNSSGAVQWYRRVPLISTPKGCAYNWTTTALPSISCSARPFGGVLISGNRRYVTTPSTGGLNINSVVVDSSGNVYVTGQFFGATTVTFNTTSGSPISINKSDSDFSAYLAKYNASGVIQWAIRPISYTTAGQSSIYGMKTVGTDLYTIGTAPGTLSATTSYSIMNSNGVAFRSAIPVTSPYASTWLIKYNSSGNVVWATRCCEGQESRGIAIDVDPSGGIYVGGKLFATATYTVWQVNGTSDQATSASIVATAGADGFLIKYSSAGARVWSAAITGSSGDVIWNSNDFIYRLE